MKYMTGEQKRKKKEKKREKLSKKKSKKTPPPPKKDTSQVERKYMYIKIDVTYMIIRQSTTHFNNIEKKCTALSDMLPSLYRVSTSKSLDTEP
jgi:hypothetical protein